MVNKKISELAPAATITGTEVVPLLQAGTTVAATVQQLLALIVAGAPGNLDTFFETATRLGLDEATVTTLQTLVAGKADAATVSATSVTLWKANTAYAVGQAVLNPAGAVVTALTNFTSGSTFDAADWSTPAASGPTLDDTTTSSSKVWSSSKVAAQAALDQFTKSTTLRIIAKGDSITLGGEDGTGISWPDLIARAVPGLTIINNGQGGYTSTEVAITDGAINPTLGAFTIPTSTAATTVTITAPAADFRPPPSGVTYSWTGVLTAPGGATYAGTLVHNVSSADSWTFAAATAPGSPVAVSAGATFHATSNDDKTDSLAVIAVGRNNQWNASGIVADVNAMIARLSSTVKRYLVLGVTTQVSETTGSSGNTQVLTANTALAAAFGQQYVDVRGYLMTSGLAFSGLTATTNDTADLAGGTIPRQLMHTDGLHPNRYGYRAIAKTVLDRLQALGWVPAAPAPIPTTAPANIYPEPGFEAGRSLGMTSNLAGNGTITVSTLAARTGRYGLRAAVTSAVSNPQVTVNVTLLAADANIAHSASVWVRPSKTVTVTPYTNYFDAGYGYLTGDTGTAQTAPAGVWTKIVIPAGNVPTAAVNYQFVLQANGPFAAGDLIDFDDVQVTAGGATTPDPVTSVAGRNGDVVLTKTDVGLPNVANTADSAKPVSTAQAAADLAAQSQLVGINTQTVGYTTVLTDAGKQVEYDSTSAGTFTIPPNTSAAYPVGAILSFYLKNTGALTIAGGAGVTLRSPAGLRLTTQYATATAMQRAVNEWVVSGYTVV